MIPNCTSENTHLQQNPKWPSILMEIDPYAMSASALVLIILAPSKTRLQFMDLNRVKKFNPLYAFDATKTFNLLLPTRW